MAVTARTPGCDAGGACDTPSRMISQPLSCAVTRSASVPDAISRPLATMAMRLQSVSASDRMCELKKTVRPSSRSRRISARTSRRPSGSRPDIGSSRKIDLGVVDQRLGQPDALNHPLRELAQLEAPLGAEPDLVEQPRHAGGPLGAPVAEQAGEVAQQLLGGEVVVEVRVLGQVADPPLHLEVAERPAENRRRPGRRVDQLHQQLEGRGLAGAVRPEESEDLARLDGEGQAVEGAVRPRPPEADLVVLRKLVRFDSRHDRQENRLTGRDGFTCGAPASSSSCSMARSMIGTRSSGIWMPLTKKVGVDRTPEEAAQRRCRSSRRR